MPTTPVRLLLLLSACATPALAQDAGAGHPCASTLEPAQRLACYDRAFPPPPALREAAAARAVGAFGLPRRAAPLRDPGQSAEGADLAQIEARISSIDHGGSGGRRTVTLDNGQRWSLEGITAGPLAPGDVVHIRQAALGSHMLRTPGGANLRARRVR